jgi:microcystin-dependent protein
MALYPPTYMQEGSYPAQYDRLFLQDVTRSTSLLLSGSGAYLVSQHAGTPGMSVDIAPGRISVVGTDAPNQGSYICWSDTVVNPSVTASPPAGQSRIDNVVVQVRDDNVIGGGNNDFQIKIVTGTPATTGSQSPPTLAPSSVLLAQILVGPLASSVTNAMITDSRPGVLAFPQPSGALQPWLGDSTSPPPGWTVGDGRAISRTGAGAALFAMWGTRFGVGDNSTTFNVPDVRGLLPVFFGGAINLPMGAVGGAQSATLGTQHIPQLSAGLSISDSGHSHGATAGTSGFMTYYSPSTIYSNASGSPANHAPAYDMTAQTSTAVGAANVHGSVTLGNPSPASFQIVPPVIGVVPLIKL